MARTKAKPKKKTKTAGQRVTKKVKTAAPKKARAKAAPAKATKTKAKAPVARAKAGASRLKGVAAAALGTLGVIAAVASTSKKAKRANASNPVDYGRLLAPLEDRIVVKVEAASEQTTGGLYIPGTVVERPTRGLVVAVGRGVRNKKGQLRPLEVTVGETVLFAESAGSKLTIEGSEVMVIRESELLGVVG